MDTTLLVILSGIGIYFLGMILAALCCRSVTFRGWISVDNDADAIRDADDVVRISLIWPLIFLWVGVLLFLCFCFWCRELLGIFLGKISGAEKWRKE